MIWTSQNFYYWIFEKQVGKLIYSLFSLLVLDICFHCLLILFDFFYWIAMEHIGITVKSLWDLKIVLVLFLALFKNYLVRFWHAFEAPLAPFENWKLQQCGQDSKILDSMESSLGRIRLESQPLDGARLPQGLKKKKVTSPFAHNLTCLRRLRIMTSSRLP